MVRIFFQTAGSSTQDSSSANRSRSKLLSLLAVSLVDFFISVRPVLISRIPLEIWPTSESNSFSSRAVFNVVFSSRATFCNPSIIRRSSTRLLRSLFWNSLESITTPLIPGSARFEASLTSPAFSPKMARSNFSSGVGSVSPLGVTFPISISPSLIWAPIRTIPSSFNSLVASSLTFGISGVNSSSPRLVSRTSNSISLIWMDV